MKKLVLFLAIAAVCCVSLGVAQAQDYVFEGSPDYEYISQDMTIGIRRVQEDGVTYFLSDVTIHDSQHLATALAGKYEGVRNGKKTEPTSDIALRNQAVLAINADNFNSHKYGLIVRNGQVLRQNGTTRHLMSIDAAGNLDLFTDQQDAGELKALAKRENVSNTFEFGPVLVKDGQAVDLNQSFKLIATRDSVLEPRTAIGQLAPLRYLIIVVDGRREGYSRGMNLRQLQSLFLRYGAQNAFNLDGGGSTTLYFNGQVINRPSGGRQRAVSDIIYFR